MPIQNPLSATYEGVCDEFDWEVTWDSVDGTPDSFNLGDEILAVGDNETTAITIVYLDDRSDEIVSIGNLAARSRQFATFLKECGLSRGVVSRR